MSTPRSAVWLIASVVLFAFAPVARADEWVTCKRHASTGQLVWLLGKASEPLDNALFRPSATNPDLGSC